MPPTLRVESSLACSGGAVGKRVSKEELLKTNRGEMGGEAEAEKEPTSLPTGKSKAACTFPKQRIKLEVQRPRDYQIHKPRKKCCRFLDWRPKKVSGMYVFGRIYFSWRIVGPMLMLIFLTMAMTMASTKWIQKGAQSDQNGGKRVPKWAKEPPKTAPTQQGRKSEEIHGFPGCFLGAFGCHFCLKSRNIASKKSWTNRAPKNMEFNAQRVP